MTPLNSPEPSEFSDSEDVTMKKDPEILLSDAGSTPKAQRTLKRTTTIIFDRIQRKDHLPIHDNILDLLHEDHKNVSPLMCIGLLYIFLVGDTNWLCLAMMQIGIQALLFSKALLKNRYTRKLLVFICISMLITAIIALSAIRKSDLRGTTNHQLVVFFFIFTGFIGFILTNLYNINLIFVFGRQVKWLLRQEKQLP